MLGDGIMSRKEKALLIVNIFFGVILVLALATSILLALNVQFMIDFEWHAIQEWGWEGFNLLTWSLVVAAICAVIIIASLTISDDRRNRPTRTRRIHQ